MKLSNLYTEDTLSETNRLKKLIGFAGKAFGRARRTPNVKFMRVQRALDEVFPDVWANYHKNPKAQARLEAYKTGSFQQYFPQLSQIQDPVQLKEEIRRLLKERAERILHQLQDPRAKYQGLGLNPEQVDRFVQKEQL
jgi:hypothetical protein